MRNDKARIGDTVRLDEFDKVEWRDVCKALRPDIHDAEFEDMWEEFCDMKKKKGLQ